MFLYQLKNTVKKEGSSKQISLEKKGNNSDLENAGDLDVIPVF